ncbi:UNKNOWN [Stylonychia lemnae]|uniref:Transmembrane protein n=1 Tax=Stylonychia lemnae TaxID=5949 RepID=A0A078B273_STYLE|nr:UNKNOWN [Stylonychia lemnae]|eukprot:CDW87533.1 UNKNOWN [Stylonychia lemnae]
MKKFNRKLENFITSQDQFGQQISFTYKNSSNFQSLFGGIVTLIFRVGILIFLITEVIKVIQKKSTITSSYFTRNLALDTRHIDANEEIFDIGLNILSVNKTVEQNFQRFIDVQISQTSFEWVNNSQDYVSTDKPYTLGKCDKGRFLGETVQTQSLGIPDTYYCPQNLKTTFQGQFSTRKSQYLTIEVKKCNNLKNPSVKCASEEEIKKAFDLIEINIVITNQFIDVNEKYKNPVKTILKNFYATSKEGLNQAYQLKFGQNFLIQSTSSFSNQFGQENITYYTVRNDVMQINAYDDKFSQTLLAFYIQLDDTIITTNLEIYTVSDALSSTGGLIGIVTIIIKIMVNQIQKDLYEQSLVKDLFQIQQDKSGSINEPKQSQVQDQNLNLKSVTSEEQFQSQLSQLHTDRNQGRLRQILINIKC